MKQETIEILKERYEKIKKRREEEQDDMDFGLGFAYILDDTIYPVQACFKISGQEEVTDKLNYLVNGGKK